MFYTLYNIVLWQTQTIKHSRKHLWTLKNSSEKEQLWKCETMLMLDWLTPRTVDLMFWIWSLEVDIQREEWLKFMDQNHLEKLLLRFMQLQKCKKEVRPQPLLMPSMHWWIDPISARLRRAGATDRWRTCENRSGKAYRYWLSSCTCAKSRGWGRYGGFLYGASSSYDVSRTQKAHFGPSKNRYYVYFYQPD